MILLTMLVVGFIAYTPHSHRAPTRTGYEGQLSFYIQRQLSQRLTARRGGKGLPQNRGHRRHRARREEDLNSYSSTGFSLAACASSSRPARISATPTPQLSDRIDRVKPSLPDDIDRINVYRFDQNDRPMMNLVAAAAARTWTTPPTAWRTSSSPRSSASRAWATSRCGASSRARCTVELLDDRLRSHKHRRPRR